MILVALMLVPLMLFAAFAVDLAGWYSRISQLQKAADAAALAGTVWMPEFTTAEAVACESLKRNGFACNDNSDSVDIHIEVGSTSTSLRVILTDTSVTRYFSGVMGAGKQTLTRSAEAEYNLPLPLGSPLNYFGGDNSKSAEIDLTRSPRFWASIGGPADTTDRGDAFASRCRGGSSGCPVTTVDPENVLYRPDGYWYVIEVPAGGSAAPIEVRIFDAAFHPAPANPGTTLAGDTKHDGTPDFETEFRLYRQDLPTDMSSRSPVSSFVDNDPASQSGYWRLTGEAPFQGVWQTLYTIPAGQTGGARYLLNVKTHGDTSAGVNGYAVEAVSSGCGPSGSCQPRVFANASMNLKVNVEGTATFYLAEVGPQYAGRTLVLELFDAGDLTGGGNAVVEPLMPGEGGSNSVPNRAVPSCRYEVASAPNTHEPNTSPDIAETSLSGGCALQVTSGSTRRTNDTWLRIRIPIPS
ncbi:MAG: pilus assembly protein TadG-related protein, partial [Acidimicrobiia bacterium]